MTTTNDTPSVLIRRDGRIGHLTLNRPDTLNALTLDMVRLIATALDRWETDEQVASVVIDGAGDRALCAGGDIRAIYDAARIGDRSPTVFWREEYALNSRIARYPKPIVAIMDGIVMGGGVGISAHASHRVVTERSMVAMPETGIGFAPDVGGTWLLSRAPGELGTHLALTGARASGPDAIVAGLADHFVASTDIERLVAGVASGPLPAAVGAVAVHPDEQPDSALAASREWIDAAYTSYSVLEILHRLERRSEPAAAEAADALRRNSPTSVEVTRRALLEASDLRSLEECLELEYRISCAFLDTPDFVEGVRAAIVDKDRSPTWVPATFDQVTEDQIDRFFTTPDVGDLGLVGTIEPASSSDQVASNTKVGN
jgi:enoyl-CoA hydratase